MNYGLLLLAAVFAGNLYFGEAIQCYACIYSTDFPSRSTSGCNDGKDFSAADSNGTKLPIMTCSGQCSKLKVKLGSHTNINRDCASHCIQALAGGLGNACCNTDFCNAAWRMAQTTPAFVLAAVVALLLAGFNRG